MVNIVSLQNIKEEAKPLVGFRVVLLSNITKSVATPLGFVITSELYHTFMESTGLNRKIGSILNLADLNDLDNLQKIANEIQKLILSTPLPKDAADEISEAYESLSVDSGSASVKSMIHASAEPAVYINPSPLTETAYGAHHGFPNVMGKERVLGIVSACFASNFTIRAIENRLKDNIDDKGLSVVIQKMCYPAVSGMVSMGYLDETRHLIITSVYGFLNDDILDMADEYIIDYKKHIIVKKDLSVQRFEFRKALESDELEKRDIGEERAARQKLPDDEIIKLADSVRGIFALTERPVMFEYGIEKGKLFILQADEVPVYEDKDLASGGGNGEDGEPESSGTDASGRKHDEKKELQAKLGSDNKNAEGAFNSTDMPAQETEREESEEEGFVIDIKEENNDIVPPIETPPTELPEEKKLEDESADAGYAADEKAAQDISRKQEAEEPGNGEEPLNKGEKRRSFFSIFMRKKHDENPDGPEKAEDQETPIYPAEADKGGGEETDGPVSDSGKQTGEVKAESEALPEKEPEITAPADITRLASSADEDSDNPEENDAPLPPPAPLQEDINLAAAKQMLGQTIVSCDLAVFSLIKTSYRTNIGSEEGLYFDEIIDELKKKVPIPFEIEIRKLRAIRNKFTEKGIVPPIDEVKFAVEIAENFVASFR